MGWGHSNELDTDKYLKLWMSIGRYNEPYVRDFHPLNETDWPSLAYVPGDLGDLLKSLQSDEGDIRSNRRSQARASPPLALSLLEMASTVSISSSVYRHINSSFHSFSGLTIDA